MTATYRSFVVFLHDLLLPSSFSVVCLTPARDAMSVLVGGDADDQCECESGALSDVGECGK